MARAVLAGGDNWMHQRYLVSYTTDSKFGNPAMVERLPADAQVMTQAALSKLMADVAVT